MKHSRQRVLLLGFIFIQVALNGILFNELFKHELITQPQADTLATGLNMVVMLAAATGISWALDSLIDEPPRPKLAAVVSVGAVAVFVASAINSGVPLSIAALGGLLAASPLVFSERNLERLTERLGGIA